MRKTPVVIAAMAFSVLAATGARAAQDDPFPLSVGTLRVTSDTGAEVDFTLTSAPGHYVYADQLSATVRSPEGVSLEELVMPPPVVRDDPYLNKQIEIYEGAARFTAKLKIPGRTAVDGKGLVLLVRYQGCSKDLCFMPTSVTLEAKFGGAGGIETRARGDGIDSLQQKYEVVGLPALRFTDAGGTEYEGDRINGYLGSRKLREAIRKVASGKGSYEQLPPIDVSLATFLVVLAGGLLLTFTPCVWPMIPITTSIVLGSKKPGTGVGLILSSSYVLGLAVVYAILGTVIASVGGLVGSSLQSPYVLPAVSALFVAMALSMFGLYDLPLLSVGAGKFGGGGVAASFVLGGISALVLSPCIGPVVASLLLYVAKTGKAAVGASLLFVFGLGMGLPLIAIGTFSGAMQKLPRSGAWMLEVKKLFGVLLVGFAVYFLFPLLSPAQEWIVSGAAASAVAVGFIVFDVRRNFPSILGKAKLGLGILIIAGGILAVISAPAEGPREGLRMRWYHSFDEARRAAAQQGKPIMIDFCAEWCTACKEMDARAFSDEEVIRAAEGVIPVKIDLTQSAPDGANSG